MFQQKSTHPRERKQFLPLCSTLNKIEDLREHLKQFWDFIQYLQHEVRQLSINEEFEGIYKTKEKEIQHLTVLLQQNEHPKD